jgi:hypothetical protein
MVKIYDQSRKIFTIIEIKKYFLKYGIVEYRLLDALSIAFVRIRHHAARRAGGGTGRRTFRGVCSSCLLNSPGHEHLKINNYKM